MAPEQCVSDMWRGLFTNLQPGPLGQQPTSPLQLIETYSRAGTPGPAPAIGLRGHKGTHLVVGRRRFPGRPEHAVRPRQGGAGVEGMTSPISCVLRRQAGSRVSGRSCAAKKICLAIPIEHGQFRTIQAGSALGCREGLS